MSVRCLLLSLTALLPQATAHAQKAGGSAWDKAAPLPAPLGQIGGVVEAPPRAGLPGGEKALQVKLPGCDRVQVLWLSRFLAGVVLGGEQLQAWLDRPGAAPPGLQARLFGRGRRLEQALARARKASFYEGRACEPIPSQGWQPVPASAPPGLCKPDLVDEASGGDHWFVLAGQRPSAKSLAALVRVLPAPDDREDRCRPRLAAVLFDDGGRARLRYHADYGGELVVELVGDGCQVVELRFDPKAQGFRPLPRRADGCRQPQNK